jgi:hypothetical protein
MLWVFPVAMLIQRMGRRFGFRVGSTFGVAGAGVVGYGLYFAGFPAMCLGGLGPGLRAGPCSSAIAA